MPKDVLKYVHYDLVTFKFDRRLKTFVGNPSWKILYLSPSRQTLSKAFPTSKKDAITSSPRLKLSITVWDRGKYDHLLIWPSLNLTDVCQERQCLRGIFEDVFQSPVRKVS